MSEQEPRSGLVTLGEALLAAEMARAARAAELLQAEEAARLEAIQELAEEQAKAVAELLRMESHGAA